MVGGATWCVFQVRPPSEDTATDGTWAKLLLWLRLRKSL